MRALFVLCLVCFVHCQYPFEAFLNGKSQVPQVRTSRTAVIRLSSASFGVTPIRILIETNINDMTSLEFYAPAAPGLEGSLLATVPNPSLDSFLPIGISEEASTNYYDHPFLVYLLSNQVYAVIRTTAFPQGEVRGNFFVGVISPGFVGANLFPAVAPQAGGPDVTCFGTECQWRSLVPLPDASVELQGPNGMIIPLQGEPFLGSSFMMGSFSPPPTLMPKLLDYGIRGELRMAYFVSSKEFVSTALSVSIRDPTYRAILNGSNMDPPVRTSASGVCKFSTGGGVVSLLTVTVTHSVIDGSRALVNLGKHGRLVSDLQPGAVQLANNFRSASFLNENPTVGDGEISNWFVKITSLNHRDGEIGGWVTVNPLEIFSDKLSPQKVKPPVSSNAFGEATLQYDDILNRIFFYINATAPQIKSIVLRGPASARSNGPELAILCSFKCEARLLFIGALDEGSSAFLNGETIQSVLAILRQGAAYIEVQTTQFPRGELRANLPRPTIEKTQTPIQFRFPIDKPPSYTTTQTSPAVQPPTRRNSRRPRRSRQPTTNN